MSLAKREQILVRLLAIGSEVDGIDKAVRNDVQRSDVNVHFCLLDGDEETDEGDSVRTRPSNAPRRVVMTPEIYLILSKKTEEVGTQLNLLRERFVAAVFADATMRTILGTNGTIEYLGLGTDLARGRTMVGEMGIGLSFHYILQPTA